MSRGERCLSWSRTCKCQANLVNFVSFRITSCVYHRNNTVNHLFPNWEHEDRNLNLFRERRKYITLSEAGIILEQVKGRLYGRTALTKRVICHNLGVKSNGKQSQWLIDREAFEKFIESSRAGD